MQRLHAHPRWSNEKEVQRNLTQSAGRAIAPLASCARAGLAWLGEPEHTCIADRALRNRIQLDPHLPHPGPSLPMGAIYR